MNSLLQVGTSKDAIIEARKSILEILKSNAEQKTIRLALKTFSTICEVNNVTVSGCNFSAK